MQGEKSPSTVLRNSRISSYTALEPIKDISTINTTTGFMTEQHKVQRTTLQVLRGSTVWFAPPVVLTMLANFSSHISDKPRSGTLRDWRLSDSDLCLLSF